jgi:hypothetical protein
VDRNSRREAALRPTASYRRTALSGKYAPS